MRPHPVTQQIFQPELRWPLTFSEIYVPHRPILAKFRLGFWQIVCPGHRGTVRSEVWHCHCCGSAVAFLTSGKVWTGAGGQDAG